MGTTQLSQSAPQQPVATPRVISVAILAMGGEGGGVLADWIVDMAEQAGYMAQTTSVPGVAQRTGATIYYVELFPEDVARKAGKDPVMALMPVPGEVDVVIASELMEAGRAITRGLVTPDRTTLIASTNRVYAMTEKIAMGDGRADGEAFLQAGRAMAKKFVHHDFARLAEDNRSVISATLFGALAASASLPFTRQQFETAIERSGIAVDSSLKAFAAGVQAASSPPAESVTHVVAQPRLGPVLTPLAARVQAEFPQGSHAVLLAGIQRLADYQDVAYATEYLDFLKAIAAIERRRGADDCPVLHETGRYLALWMSYEDAIRVADLKSRRTRFERVQREARVGSEQMLLINEFLYPRIEEFADIMPAALGGWMVRTGWVRRLVDRMAGHGKVLNTTSILGFSQLYLLAGLRRWRRKSLRFRREQKGIAGWLSQVKETAANNYDLAVELAECPRLVKGYGDTHALGSRNFESLMDALPTLRKIPDGAARLKRLRELALADDTGKKLADALKELSL